MRSSVNSTQGTVLFSRERGKLNPVISSVNGTEGTVPFSRKRRRAGNTTLENIVDEHQVHCYFPWKEENLNNPLRNNVNLYTGYSAMSLVKGKN